MLPLGVYSAYAFLLSGLFGNCILGKVDKLFKFNSKFRYLEMEDLLQEFLIKDILFKCGYFEIKIEEITAGPYFLSAADIANIVHQIGVGALLIANNYTLAT